MVENIQCQALQVPSNPKDSVSFWKLERWQGEGEGQARNGRESLGSGDRAGGDVSPAPGIYAHSNNIPLSIQLCSFSLLSKTARQDLLVVCFIGFSFCQHVEDSCVLTEPQIVPPKDDAEKTWYIGRKKQNASRILIWGWEKFQEYELPLI